MKITCIYNRKNEKSILMSLVKELLVKFSFTWDKGRQDRGIETERDHHSLYYFTHTYEFCIIEIKNLCVCILSPYE